MILNLKEKPTDNWEYSESLVYIAGKIFRQYTIDWREYKGGINGSNVPIEALSRMKSEAYVGNGADEDYQYNIFQQLGTWWFLCIDIHFKQYHKSINEFVWFLDTKTVGNSPQAAVGGGDLLDQNDPEKASFCSK